MSNGWLATCRYVFISSIRDDMLSDCTWHFKVLIIRLKCLCLFDFVPVFWHQRSHSCIFHKSLAEMKTHYNFLFRIRPCVVVHNLVKTKNRSRNRSHKCDRIEESGAEALCDWFSSFTFTWDSDEPAFTRP